MNGPFILCEVEAGDEAHMISGGKNLTLMVNIAKPQELHALRLQTYA